jgi:hypothetical protein
MMLFALIAIAVSSTLTAVVLETIAKPASVAFATTGARVGASE